MANMILCVAAAAAVKASLVAEEVLREGGDAVRVVFNKFHSAISFKPTMATVLNAEVRHDTQLVLSSAVTVGLFNVLCLAISFKPTKATVLNAEVRHSSDDVCR
jgi:F0F1-type ATP synthase gamma subunit